MHTIRSTYLILFLIFPLMGNGQDPAIGDWEGMLKAGGSELRIRFHIEKSGEGLKGTMDSPDQGVEGIEMDSVRRKADSLWIDLQGSSAHYEARFVDNDSLEGEWTQRGAAYELDMGKGVGSKGFLRPQTPEPPYPYRSIDTSFQQEPEGFRMGGTVTMPEGKGPFPGIVFVSGSGPQDRNETIAQHEPFHVIAHHLTKQGFAVLRYDDRGVADSEGSFEGSGIEDFTDDARSAYQFLKSFEEVDSNEVGMLGHSEGGVVVSRLATLEGDPAFLVLMASPAMRGDSTLLMQNRAILSEMGMEEGFIEAQLKVVDSLTNYIREGRGPSFIQRRTRVLVKEEFKDVMDSTRMERTMDRYDQYAHSAWFRSFIQDDPAAFYRQLEIPVLALFGENDLQVLAEPNAERMRKALSGGPNQDIRKIEGVNHLFQPDERGLPSRYGQIKTTIHPPVLDHLANWLEGIMQE